MGFEHPNAAALLAVFNGTIPNTAKLGATSPNQHPQLNLLRCIERPTDVNVAVVVADIERHLKTCWMGYGKISKPEDLAGTLRNAEQWTDNHPEVYLGWAGVGAWWASKEGIAPILAAFERWFVALQAGLVAGSTPSPLDRCVFPGARSDGATVAHGKDGSSSYYDSTYRLIRSAGRSHLPKNKAQDTIGLFCLSAVLLAGKLKMARAVTMENCETQLPPGANAWEIYRCERGHVGVMETTYGIQPQAWAWVRYDTGRAGAANIDPAKGITAPPAFSDRFEHLSQADMRTKADEIIAAHDLGEVTRVIRAPVSAVS